MKAHSEVNRLVKNEGNRAKYGRRPTLGGSGAVGDLNNLGTVAPDNSIGTLTVSGDDTHAAGSVCWRSKSTTGWSAYLDYDALVNEHQIFHVGSGGVGYTW
jgi:hypothetical protein